MKVSIFTNFLNELLRYSKKNDSAAVKYADFVSIQKLETRIIDCYQRNSISHNEYRLLIDTCFYLKTQIREAIRVKNEVKTIERQLLKDRRLLA